ncbi:MAG: hypothetical protein JWM31_3183, partial [Solirubrobacterales bacterium]|nr:hypothetical protein [Solirubrobacterales bacterium]
PVTAAVGVAILDEPSAAGLLAAADDAMYRDKPGRRAGPDPPRP